MHVPVKYDSCGKLLSKYPLHAFSRLYYPLLLLLLLYCMLRFEEGSTLKIRVIMDYRTLLKVCRIQVFVCASLFTDKPSRIQLMFTTTVSDVRAVSEREAVCATLSPILE